MKHLLEESFDIPFVVRSASKEFWIMPKNEMEELFEIHISLRSGVRLIIEAYPQRHAADMLHDMEKASAEKRALFQGYYNAFLDRGCIVHITVNNSDLDFSAWPTKWKSLSVRITKIIEDETEFDNGISDWAIQSSGLMLSLLNVVPVDGRIEGKKEQVLVNKYERNPLNRELCILKHGCFCNICGFDFEKTYGTIGRGFIHVHHIEQLSLGGERIINPERDLIPVCPNCHAMLHTSTPPLLPEELKKTIKC